MLSQEILRSIPASIKVIRRLSTNQLDGSITLNHLRLLFLVSEGSGQSQMANVLQISLPAVSKMVNGLVIKGLVRRSPGKDKRCLTLKLSVKGRKTLGTVSKKVEKEIDNALINLSATECQDLEKGLQALNKLMIHLKED